MVTWACRGSKALIVVTGSLNLLLIAATFMTGAHYFVDVVLTVPLFVAAVALHRKIVEPRWLGATLARAADEPSGEHNVRAVAHTPLED